MPRLQSAIAREHEDTQCFCLLCLLVGCRRGEALTLRWADLDVERRVCRKPVTKTGRAHTVPIPAGLLDRLKALPRHNEFIFATNRLVQNDCGRALGGDPLCSFECITSDPGAGGE